MKFFLDWLSFDFIGIPPYLDQLFNDDGKIFARHPEGGGVTTIYAGTGCAIFWGAFFRAENIFWGIIFGKITIQK